MRWLDNIPLMILAFIAVALALAPFGFEPHLVEKIKMLFNGELKKPIDIFDLFMHATPLVLLGIKLYRQYILGINSESNNS